MAARSYSRLTTGTPLVCVISFRRAQRDSVFIGDFMIDLSLGLVRGCTSLANPFRAPRGIRFHSSHYLRHDFVSADRRTSSSRELAAFRSSIKTKALRGAFRQEALRVRGLGGEHPVQLTNANRCHMFLCPQLTSGRQPAPGLGPGVANLHCKPSRSGTSRRFICPMSVAR
jgi:hypothetical protein